MCDCSLLSNELLSFNKPWRSIHKILETSIISTRRFRTTTTTTLSIRRRFNITQSRVSSSDDCKPLEEAVDLNSRSSSSEAESKKDGDLSSFDFIELKRELEKLENGRETKNLEAESGLVQKEGLESDDSLDSGESSGNIVGPPEELKRRRRQLIRRSSILAKQVISIESARSLGFVSQLWVDTRSWMVILIEVRPNLLSGDFEKFLLEDIFQVGDVVLVQDESVMDDELKLMGLDTLVGYNVITSGRKDVGRVRGYTFNVNSGAVESLELDSFGVSFIPSSLVSTYCLFVKDVLEVVSDTVVVPEDAISRVQRITKGVWDSRNITSLEDEIEDYSDFGRHRSRLHRGRSQRNARRKNSHKEQWILRMIGNSLWITRG